MALRTIVMLTCHTLWEYFMFVMKTKPLPTKPWHHTLAMLTTQNILLSEILTQKKCITDLKWNFVLSSWQSNTVIVLFWPNLFYSSNIILSLTGKIQACRMGTLSKDWMLTKAILWHFKQYCSSIYYPQILNF